MPDAKPKMMLFILSPIFLKKKTKLEPNVVAMNIIDIEIIDTVILFTLKS